MKKRHLIASFLSLAVIFSGLARGQTTLADLDGSWTIQRFYLPGSVATDGFGNFLPLQGTGPNAQIVYEGDGGFEEISGDITSQGTLSASVTATSIPEELGDQLVADVSLSRNGVLQVLVEDETVRLYPNASQSMLLSMSTFGVSEDGGPEESEVLVVTRNPASPPSAAGLAGTWILAGSYLNDVFNSWEFDSQIPITLNSNGTGSATVPGEGELQFTFTLGLDGKVNINLGEEVEVWNINSGLDVLVRLTSQVSEEFNPENTNPAWGDIEVMNEYDFSLILRQPETLSLEEIVGVWDVFIFTSEVDATVVDPSGGADPDFEPFNNLLSTNTERLRLQVNPEGTFEATSVEAGPGTDILIGELTEGTIQIVEGSPRLSFTADGDPTQVDFLINASKDFMVTFDAETPGQTNEVLDQEIVMAVKREEADLGLWETTPGAAAGSWLNLPWFGNLFLLDTVDEQWIYHFDHGWLYLLGRRVDGFWSWFPDFALLGDPAGSALWTSQSLYPWFLRVNEAATGNNPAPGFSWVYFAKPYYEETGELWFRDIDEETWLRQTPARPPVQ